MIDINSKLSGRYIISQLIGTGGMANVYLARDLILDRDVAVKVLRFDFQDNKDAIRRFQREAMAASQLLHHNVVEVYDVDEEDGQQYIVMEFVKGNDLKNFIRDKSPISLELVVNIMSQILSAIDIAHRNNIIHRDIKPQNILMNADNEVKITDFGIAVVLSDTSLTQTNTLLGSVHYLSPEQARGANATIKSDIYALGVVLYELITGEVPYDGESAVSVALKHFQEEFPRVKEKLDYVPQSLENVVIKATAKSPEHRYNSAQEMLSDLSTSLSVNRMDEKPFDPKADPEDTLILNPIKPISNASQVLSQADVQEDFQEEFSDDILQYHEFPQVGKPRRLRKIISWLTVIALGILLVLGGYAIYNQTIRYVNVPEVGNLTQAEAVKLLTDNNIEVGNVINNWHNSIVEGNVIGTDPEAGQKVERNSSVNLIVSSGEEQVQISDYTGQSYEPIRQLLIDAGFIVERQDLFTNDASQTGTILAQSIEAGSHVVPGRTAITLTVGSYSESSVMQDFYNLSESMVQSFADGYGLYVDVSYEYSDFIPEGQVISQSPESGSLLYPGDTISVVVSMGQEEEEISTSSIPIYIEYLPTYENNDTEQETPLPNNIQVYIGDEYNNITDLAEEFEIRESQTIGLTLYISSNGTGQYRIIRDGEVYEESNNVVPQ
ncbi:Stk1 family PASTA domain-containing Ser/Thr kinase [Aerococcaceae bacterium WGS1372]